MPLRVHTLDNGQAVEAPDVYFTAGYGRAEEECTQGSWVLLEAFDGGWQMPVIVRRLDSPAEAISPYGYSGVYGHGISRRDAESAWVSARSALRDLGVTSLFLRRSPLVPQATLPSDAVAVIAHHATRAIPVSSPDEMWAGMESRARNMVRRAMREGLTADVRPAITADLVAGSPFRTLYETTMARRQARDVYYFPAAYYLKLLDGLGESLWIGEVRSEEGLTVAAALFMRHGRMLHYHLSGARPEVRGASNLLIWTALQHAADAGLEVVHLGGGVADGDSLYAFKRSFGGHELSFSAYGLVLDPTAYRVAVARRADELGTTSEVLARSTVFPAYRARS